MKILGVDPGLRVTGYGVILQDGQDVQLIEAGVIKTTTKAPIAARLAEIHEGLMSLIADTEPDVMVIEKLYSDYRHPTTAILMGHARGVICLAAGLNKIPLESLPSTRVKKMIVSHGHASKDQVGRAIQGILGLKEIPKPADVSDALAIAIGYGLTKAKFNARIMY